MSKKPFFSKIIKFPSGDPILPEGYTTINQVKIGNGGIEYYLPIPVCVKENATSEETIKEIFSALAIYYGWKKSSMDGYCDEGPIAVLDVLGVCGYVVPIDINYQALIDQTMLQIIMFNLAVRYKWKTVEDPKFDKFKQSMHVEWDDDEDDDE